MRSNTKQSLGPNGHGASTSSRGSGRVRLADVAKKAGVAQMTVSRALSRPEAVSEKLRLRINRAIDTLGYMRDNRASALASGEAKLIPVLIPTLHHSVFVSFLDGLYSALQNSDYEILLGLTEYQQEREESFVQAVLGWHPSGVVLAGLEHSARTKKLLRGAKIPVIEVMDYGASPIDQSVGFSHETVGKTVADYLATLGRQRIAYAAAAHGFDTRSQKRLASFRGVLEPRKVTRFFSISWPGPSSIQTGRMLLDKTLREDSAVDAIFFTNDDLAAGAIFECLERGIRVPEDIAIVGFNDLEIASEMSPSITSVRTPLLAIGMSAGEKLLKSLKGERERPRAVDLGFELIERASTSSV